jgi:hypothetical protein
MRLRLKQIAGALAVVFLTYNSCRWTLAIPPETIYANTGDAVYQDIKTPPGEPDGGFDFSPIPYPLWCVSEPIRIPKNDR